MVIRTNSASTELVVNAAHDTVKHFDSVGTVHVIAVDSENCYEENGKAAFTQVDSGKYKTTATADVELLFVSSATNVKVAVTPGTVDHAHAISDGDAASLNSDEKNENHGVTFDYDGNIEQATIEDVYHHVTDDEKISLSTNFENNKENETVADIIGTLVEKEAVKADESDFWIVCHADEFASGTGTENDPYIIKTARQLSLLAYNVNTLAAGNYASAYYKLEKDIDLTGKAWTPIGTTNGATTVSFSGHFDGNGKSIVGLSNNGKSDIDLGLYRDELSSVKGLAATYGLFGFVQNAEFKNIKIKSANIDGSSYFKEAGFIIGTARGSLIMTSCNVDENSKFNGSSKIGGMVGYVEHNGTNGNVSFTNCSFAGTINASADRAGAMIGAFNANDIKCVYKFDNCSSTGSISATNYGVGLIGYKYQGTGGKAIDFATFEFNNCSVDLTKFSAKEGVGKYFGKLNNKALIIIDSDYDNLIVGQIQASGTVLMLKFNDEIYALRSGAANEQMPEKSSLSDTKYDIGQYWYAGGAETWSGLTSYGTNMLPTNKGYFVEINQSTVTIENGT